MPVSASDTRMYSTVTMARPPKMPRGSVFCGFLTSSADVATTSKPMKAKKTRAAPAKMPSVPYCAGAAPVRKPKKDCLRTSAVPVPPVGSEAGTNGA